MPRFNTSMVLGTTLSAVRELMEKRINGQSAPEAQTLQAGLEEFDVLWEELQAQSEQLARERQRYSDFFSFAPDAYLITDERGLIVDANRAASEMLGRSAAFLVGKPLVSFVALESRSRFRSDLAQLFGDPSTGPHSYHGVLRTGSTSTVFSVRGIQRSNKTITGYCWLLRPAL